MWYKSIKKALVNLPGEKAHTEMIPFRLPSSEYLNKINDAKLSATMCLFYKKNNEIFGILMERSHTGGKHSGQVSFPGGKKDLEDNTLEVTALRETHEEIGIPDSQIKVIGKLTNVYVPVSNFLIHPYVGVLAKEPNFKLSENEVKEIFSFKLNDLLAKNSKQSADIKNHKGTIMKSIPCFKFDHHIVWGATSLILNELKMAINNSK